MTVFCNSDILISTPMSSSLLLTFFGVVPSVRIITWMTSIFMFYSLFSSLAKSYYFSIFSISLMCTFVSYGTAKSTIWYDFFTLSMMITSGRLGSITWSVWILSSHGILHFAFSVTGFGSCSYHFFLTYYCIKVTCYTDYKQAIPSPLGTSGLRFRLTKFDSYVMMKTF